MRLSGPVDHCDADCFYVSAERVCDDFLLGKPVGVLGNQGACVIARSYEMNAAGVKVGMPIWDAVKLCPLGVYVKRDFHWYEVLSRRELPRRIISAAGVGAGGGVKVWQRRRSARLRPADARHFGKGLHRLRPQPIMAEPPFDSHAPKRTPMIALYRT
jgi:nucleotidyltransferase/DNA polymerase involved in DNA repair